MKKVTYQAYHVQMEELERKALSRYESVYTLVEKYDVLMGELQDARSNYILAAISDLSSVKQEIGLDVESMYISSIELIVEKSIQDFIKSNGFDVVLKSVESNEKEIFAVIKSKRMNSIHNGIIVEKLGEIKETNLYEDVVIKVLPIELQYILDRLKSPELVKSIKLKEQLEQEIESLNIIKLQPDSKQYKTAYYKR